MREIDALLRRKVVDDSENGVFRSDFNRLCGRIVLSIFHLWYIRVRKTFAQIDGSCDRRFDKNV